MVAEYRGPMGYGIPSQPHAITLLQDRRAIYSLQCQKPRLFEARDVEIKNLDVYKRMQTIIGASGADPDKSMDLEAIFETVFGDEYDLPPQEIGSCVQSGDEYSTGTRELIEVSLIGDPEELYGLEKLGSRSLFHFGPFSYGWGRKLAGIRGGDGSFCETQVRANVEIGYIPCSSPKLQAIMKQKYGLEETTAFPEPRGNKGQQAYKDFGNWQYLEELRSEVVAKLVETEDVKTPDTLISCIRDRLMPCAICSDWALMFDYDHPELGPIYKRNTRDSWPHRMTPIAILVDSRGRIFVKIRNTWGKVHKGRNYMLVPIELMEAWLRQAVCMAEGETDLPDSDGTYTIRVA